MMFQHATRPKHRAARHDRSTRPAGVSPGAGGRVLLASLLMLPAVALLLTTGRWLLALGGMTAVLGGAAALRRRGAVKAWERELETAFGVDDLAPP